MTSALPKRLIEVDLPIKRISKHARREKSVRHGHLSTLHIWWARRPLAACRSVLCASLWPDPADPNCPETFREVVREEMLNWIRNSLRLGSEETLARFVKFQKDPSKLSDNLELRGALLDFIADFANWDNSTAEEFLNTSRKLTRAAHESLGGTENTKPLVIDPFAGGGAIPLETLRVGADTVASDLNPVAATLNKAILEHLADLPAEECAKFEAEAAKVRDRVYANLAHLYDGGSDPAVAYIWARVIHCEGPNCGVELPLLTSPWLCKHKGRYFWLEFSSGKTKGKVVYAIRNSSVLPKPSPTGTARKGSATCPACGYTTPKKSVYRQLVEQNGGVYQSRCMAVVRNSNAGRVYSLPTEHDLRQAQESQEELNKIASTLPTQRINSISPGKFGSGVASPTRIGCAKFTDLFTARQLLVLAGFCKEIADIKNPTIQLLLAFAVDRLADYNSAHCRWAATGEFIGNTFGRQAISIVWTFAEVNPFADVSGNWDGAIAWISRVVDHIRNSNLQRGQAGCYSATDLPLPDDSVDVLFTDPPYYGAIMYGDLSDYFYIWLRRSVGERFPDIFRSGLIDKAEEIVATPTSNGPKGERKDAVFFESRMRIALEHAFRAVKPSGVAVVVFAHKTTSGWEAMLSALISAGWVVTASWPIDTERQGRTNAQGTASLGSSVHLVCRPRKGSNGHAGKTFEVGDWRDVLHELPRRIHEWMPRLAEEGVVGADAIFACLGPALEVFSRYSRVEKANGDQVSLKEFLEHVWAAVAKEALALVFEGADASGFEEDARLTAMWLWTLSASQEGNEEQADDAAEEDEDSESSTASPPKGYVLEYDAARKIAQGLGAHLESLTSLVEIKGEIARLLPVAERTRRLFGKDESESPTSTRKKKTPQLQLGFVEELEQVEEAGAWGTKGAPAQGTTVLDRVHQCMILFAAGRGEALRRFLVDEGVGRDERFWRLAQVLSYLYPKASDEKRWIDGILARKKGLGL